MHENERSTPEVSGAEGSLTTTPRHPLETNLFDSRRARENSCYTRLTDGKLTQADGITPAASEVRYIHDQFRSLVLAADFPCVGAKAAMTTAVYRFGLYTRMGTEAATAGLAYDLHRFLIEQEAMNSDFTTFVASFLQPRPTTEAQFERLLWRQLEKLHLLDVEHFAWDPSVHSDPENADFAFSVGGQAIFIAGLHAGSSEWGRVFAWPTLIFNTHRQFQRLREAGKFEKLKQTIRSRERRLQGRVFPNAADHGEISEARQYSGRLSENPWHCPFHPRVSPRG